MNKKKKEDVLYDVGWVIYVSVQEQSGDKFFEYFVYLLIKQLLFNNCVKNSVSNNFQTMGLKKHANLVIHEGDIVT